MLHHTKMREIYLFLMSFKYLSTSSTDNTLEGIENSNNNLYYWRGKGKFKSYHRMCMNSSQKFNWNGVPPCKKRITSKSITQTGNDFTLKPQSGNTLILNKFPRIQKISLLQELGKDQGIIEQKDQRELLDTTNHEEIPVEFSANNNSSISVLGLQIGENGNSRADFLVKQIQKIIAQKRQDGQLHQTNYITKPLKALSNREISSSISGSFQSENPMDLSAESLVRKKNNDLQPSASQGKVINGGITGQNRIDEILDTTNHQETSVPLSENNKNPKDPTKLLQADKQQCLSGGDLSTIASTSKDDQKETLIGEVIFASQDDIEKLAEELKYISNIIFEAYGLSKILGDEKVESKIPENIVKKFLRATKRYRYKEVSNRNFYKKIKFSDGTEIIHHEKKVLLYYFIIDKIYPAFFDILKHCKIDDFLINFVKVFFNHFKQHKENAIDFFLIDIKVDKTTRYVYNLKRGRHLSYLSYFIRRNILLMNEDEKYSILTKIKFFINLNSYIVLNTNKDVWKKLKKSFINLNTSFHGYFKQVGSYLPNDFEQLKDLLQKIKDIEINYGHVFFLKFLMRIAQTENSNTSDFYYKAETSITNVRIITH